MKKTLEKRDEIIEEMHAVREAYAARFNYDTAALFRHARERTRDSQRSVARRQPRRVERVEKAAETP